MTTAWKTHASMHEEEVGGFWVSGRRILAQGGLKRKQSHEHEKKQHQDMGARTSVLHILAHQLDEFGESPVRRVDDGRLVDGRLRPAMLHHLQVMRGSQDMLALMCAVRKRSIAAASYIQA